MGQTLKRTNWTNAPCNNILTHKNYTRGIWSNFSTNTSMVLPFLSAPAAPFVGQRRWSRASSPSLGAAWSFIRGPVPVPVPVPVPISVSVSVPITISVIVSVSVTLPLLLSLPFPLSATRHSSWHQSCVSISTSICDKTFPCKLVSRINPSTKNQLVTLPLASFSTWLFFGIL